jgi:hypothetical protein
MADHLRRPLYSLPEKLSEKVLPATESLTKITDIVAAVAAAIDKFHLGSSRTAVQQAPRPHLWRGHTRHHTRQHH